jgi:hypothetical protein
MSLTESAQDDGDRTGGSPHGTVTLSQTYSTSRSMAASALFSLVNMADMR